jgi:hypothetical protein
MIARAQKAWERLRRHARLLEEPAPGATIPSGETEGLPIYVVLTDEESDCDVDDLEDQASELGLDIENLDHFQDWSNMPKDALLLSYTSEVGGANASFDSAYTTQTPRRMIRLKDGSRAYPVFDADRSVRSGFGLDVPKKALNWTPTISHVVGLLQDRRIRKELSSNPRVQITRQSDWCIPLFDFLQLCQRHSLPIPKPFN